MTNSKDKIKLSHMTYHIKRSELGEYSKNDEMKGKTRPTFLLSGINNEWYFLVISTTTLHSGNKKTFQNKKYIEWKKGFYLRLSYENGWHRLKKSEIKNDHINLKNLIKLTDDQLKKLNKFYESEIKNQREILRNLQN